MSVLSDRIAAAATPKERSRIKAEAIQTLVGKDYDDVSGALEITRQVGAQTWRIVFDRRPAPVLDRQGNVIGIDAMVRVFRGANEMHVDPHRRFINPPTTVPDGGTRTVVGRDGQIYDLPTFVENPREAYLLALVDSLRSAPNPVGWRTPGTVTTVYSDTNDNSIMSNDAVYATAAAGAALGLWSTISPGNTAHNAGQQQYSGDSKYYIFEVFEGFDTSPIADADIISSVVHSLAAVAASSFETATTLEVRAFDWSPAVATADWRTPTQLTALTLLASIASSSWVDTINVYNALTENGSSFQSAINKTGFTYVVYDTARFAAATTPTNNEYFVFYGADASGTTSDPKLVITHASLGNPWYAYAQQ